jgi:hypothetical protein
MRRRKLIVVVGLAVLVAVGAFVLWPRPDRITQENLERIRAGMSRAEVECILGGPPGDYRSVLTVRISYDAGYPFELAGPRPAVWKGNTGDVSVHFSQQGAEMPVFLGTFEVPQSFLENVLWRAERLWRRWFP